MHESGQGEAYRSIALLHGVELHRPCVQSMLDVDCPSQLLILPVAHHVTSSTLNCSRRPGRRGGPGCQVGQVGNSNLVPTWLSPLRQFFPNLVFGGSLCCSGVGVAFAACWNLKQIWLAFPGCGSCQVGASARLARLQAQPGCARLTFSAGQISRAESQAATAPGC